MTAEGSVRLRPLELDDIVRVRDWRNLPEIREWMYTDHEISIEEHARWFGQAMSDEARRYWIIELDGEPVGLANLYDISPRHGTAYWAFYLADLLRQHIRKGDERVDVVSLSVLREEWAASRWATDA